MWCQQDSKPTSIEHADFPAFAREKGLEPRRAWLVEDNRHGALVNERDRHPGAEDASFDRDALRREGRAELLVERFGLFGRRRVREARTIALVGVLSPSEVNRNIGREP